MIVHKKRKLITVNNAVNSSMSRREKGLLDEAAFAVTVGYQWRGTLI